MKRHVVYFLTLVSICILADSAKAEERRYRDAVEFTARGGLPNFYAKLKAGKKVNIAYLGGSITCQPGYRVKSLEWFRKNFPNAEINEIFAGIGGTGSTLGAYRLEQDVLAHKPDLLFVEFAVNDLSRSQFSVIRGMEGIVRQTLRANPGTDICFVYTLTNKDLEILSTNKFQHTASAMEEVADHYGIPTIHMGLKVAQLVEMGKVIMKAPKAKVEEVADGALNQLKAGGEIEEGNPIPFSRDGVHPYIDTGHQLYMNALKRSLPEIEKAGKPGPHALPKPLNNHCLENVKIVSVKRSMLSDGWKQLDSKDPKKRFLGRFKTMWSAESPGEKLTFKFKGTECKIYDLVGPDCGQISIKIDGKELKKRARFDKYCSYHRISTLHLASNLENKIHTVELEIHPEEPAKDKILQGSRLAKFHKNPEKYKGTKWFVGGIMINGDLVE